MSPIDDWPFWGEDPWTAGVIWKKWVATGDFLLDTTMAVAVTYTATAIMSADLTTVIAVAETYTPQAGATFNANTTVTAIAVGIYTGDADFVTTSTVTANAGATFTGDADFVTTTTISVSETYTEYVLPSEISNLIGWWDADSRSTIISQNTGVAVVDGDSPEPIKQWDSKVGSVSLVESKTGNQPTWTKDEWNSLPTFTFGTAERLQIIAGGGISGFNHVYAYTVCMAVDSAGIISMVHADTNNPSFVGRVETWAGGVMRNNTTGEIESVSKTARMWMITAISGGDQKARTWSSNGASAGPSTITQDTTPGLCTQLNIGRDLINAKDANGTLGEVLVYSRELTSGERNDVAYYFETKWNI